MTNENANAKAKEPRSLSEILADAEATETWVQQMNQQINEKLEQHVQDLLFRIKILKTRTHDPNRSDEIKQTFEEAIKLEESNDLKRVAMWEYVSYLEEQGDCETAIPLAERFFAYIELNGDKSQIADAANMLGRLYYVTENSSKQAQQKFIQANEIYEQLVAENPSVSYQAKLAKTCYDLGTLYADYGDSHHMDFAKQELLRAKRIYEQLVAENQSTYLIDLAKACYCLGIVYACTNCPELANEEFCRSRDLFEQDSKIHRFIKFR